MFVNKKTKIFSYFLLYIKSVKNSGARVAILLEFDGFATPQCPQFVD
jgi:hypothetical protein